MIIPYNRKINRAMKRERWPLAWYYYAKHQQRKAMSIWHALRLCTIGWSKTGAVGWSAFGAFDIGAGDKV